MVPRSFNGRSTIVLITIVLASCRTAPDLDLDNPIRPNPAPPYGMEEFFADAAKQPVPSHVRLGRWLFFDKRLSADGTVSCATCHKPEYAFSELTPVATGIGNQRGRRKTQTIVNLAARTVLPGERDPGPTFFWDGRATSLEQQVLMPIADAKEMGMDHPAMIARLSSIPGYRPYFREAFGADTMAVNHVASALSDYVRSRVSGNAPYDQWSYGKNGHALTVQQQEGLDLFFGNANCSSCHAGFNFSDGLFWNLGVGWNEQTQSFTDEGRLAVTHEPRDRGAFKTPGLRDVAKHPPYMHDGSLATLRDVVEFYNKGGNRNPNQTKRIRPLGLLPKDIDALVAFLESLNGEGYEDRAPTYFPK